MWLEKLPYNRLRRIFLVGFAAGFLVRFSFLGMGMDERIHR